MRRSGACRMRTRGSFGRGRESSGCDFGMANVTTQPPASRRDATGAVIASRSRAGRPETGAVVAIVCVLSFAPKMYLARRRNLSSIASSPLDASTDVSAMAGGR